MNSSKLQTLFIPLGIIFIIINYHYYGFYQENFGQIFLNTSLKPSLYNNQYEAVQKYHPFYDLYLQARKYRYKPVYYLYTRYDPNNRLKIDELFIRTSYFFYPRKIVPIYSLSQFLKISFPKNSLLISDYNLNTTALSGRLQSLTSPKLASKPQDYFFKRENIYYLYGLKSQND